MKEEYGDSGGRDTVVGEKMKGEVMEENMKHQGGGAVKKKIRGQ